MQYTFVHVRFRACIRTSSRNCLIYSFNPQQQQKTHARTIACTDRNRATAAAAAQTLPTLAKHAIARNVQLLRRRRSQQLKCHRLVREQQPCPQARFSSIAAAASRIPTREAPLAPAQTAKLVVVAHTIIRTNTVRMISNTTITTINNNITIITSSRCP